jgi:hypothetical protein
MMKSALRLLAVITIFGASSLAQAGGPGSCGKGKRWNPETQKCENKPRGSQSGSHS